MEHLGTQDICLDTDIIIDFTKDREPGATCFELAQANFNCFISVISVYELYFGVEYIGHKKDRDILDELLDTFTILPFNSKAAKLCASLDANLNKIGKRLSIKDIFIGGICLANNISLLTRNIKHFSHIPNLKLIPIEKII